MGRSRAVRRHSSSAWRDQLRRHSVVRANMSWCEEWHEEVRAWECVADQIDWMTL